MLTNGSGEIGSEESGFKQGTRAEWRDGAGSTYVRGPGNWAGGRMDGWNVWRENRVGERYVLVGVCLSAVN